MLLAIDIGNTNTVFAVFKGDEFVRSWRCVTQAGRSCDEYAAFLHELFVIAQIKWSDLDNVIISSVVPEADFQIKCFCNVYLERDPVFVNKDIAGIAINIDSPEDVGADRLVNVVAIRKYYKSPAIVIDFGTATTFDVIDQNGAYAGGVIAPGINLSVEALGRHAAKLPLVSIEKPDNAIGKSTISAIRSGIFWGYTGLIEGIVKNISAELGVEPFILATGGLASLFAEDSAVIDEVDEDLTLKGLLQIYRGNKI